jgi:hypothetical protein
MRSIYLLIMWIFLLLSLFIIFSGTLDSHPPANIVLGFYATGAIIAGLRAQEEPKGNVDIEIIDAASMDRPE